MTIPKPIVNFSSVLLGITGAILIVGGILGLASWFYNLVALLAICLVVTYIMLWPVIWVERAILWCSGWLGRTGLFKILLNVTPQANPRILAVLLVYFTVIMTVTGGVIQYAPLLFTEAKGFSRALNRYADQISAHMVDWSDDHLGRTTMHRLFQEDIQQARRAQEARDQQNNKDKNAHSNVSKTLPQRPLVGARVTGHSHLGTQRHYIEHMSMDEKKIVRRSLVESTVHQTTQLLMKTLNNAVAHLIELATGTLNGLIYCLAGFLLIFYFLLDGHRLGSDVLRVLPEKSRETMQYFLSKFHGVMDSFVRGQVLLGMLTGVYMFIVYSIFGVPYALFLSVFMALAECLPVVGTWIGLAPALLVMLFTFGPAKTLLVWLFSYVYQTIKDNIIAPKIVGEAMGLHPLVVITSLLICGQLAGLLGILLALPLASALKVLIQYVSDRESVAE